MDGHPAGFSLGMLKSVKAFAGPLVERRRWKNSLHRPLEFCVDH